MSRFYTERELLFSGTLIGCFCNAKLIGKEEDPESLQKYSNQFMNIFVNNQLVFFSNGKRTIDAFIIQAGDILDSFIMFKK